MSEISEYPIKCFFDARTPAEAEALFSETPFIIEHFNDREQEIVKMARSCLEDKGFVFESIGKPGTYLVTKP